MKLIAILSLTLGILIFSSCNRRDGHYLIYSVDHTHGNQDVVNYLENKLRGSRYEIIFKDKYVSIRNLKLNGEVILQEKTSMAGTPYYFLGSNDEGVHTEFNLWQKKDNEFNLAIELRLLKDNSVIIPIQLGGLLNTKHGEVVCHLIKE